jgi:hypothetical protein
MMQQNNIPMREAFSSFDQDGDGVITRSEFSSALRKLDVGLSATQIDDVLSYIDKDGDGKISFFEFGRQLGTVSDHSSIVNTSTSHVTMLDASATGDLQARTQSSEVVAVEHILNQLAQEFGFFDDAKVRVTAAIHRGILDPRQLCHLLDRESRGFFVNSDFARTDFDWVSRFGLAASDLADLGKTMDFGVDNRLAYGDFFAQLETEANISTDYGRSRRRTGKAENFVPGPELEITHNELAETFKCHQISADQIALDLGIALDTYVSWQRVFETLGDMGLQLTAPIRRSLVRIRGSDGNLAGGVTLRDFDSAFPKPIVDTDACKNIEQDIDRIVDLMRNVYYLDFRADVFLGADRLSTATFRRRMNALLASEVPLGAINALTFAVGRSHEGDDGTVGQIWIQDVQRRCALSVKHGRSDSSERFSRAIYEPLSVDLLVRAVDAAACDDGICQLPHQYIECNTIKQWLCSDHGHSSLRQRKLSLSEAGPLVELDLSHNRIACRGAVVIARRLDADRCLQRLSLTNNRIADEGAMQLALLVQGSQTLRLVDLANNSIGQKGVDALRKARAANPTNIIRIVLDGNCPGAVVANSQAKKNAANEPADEVSGSAAKVEGKPSSRAIERSSLCRARSTLINVHRLGRRQKVL